MGRVRGLGPVLTQLVVLGAVLEVFAIVSPLLMQLVLDHVIVGGDRDLLVVLCLGFFFLMLIRVGVSALESWVTLFLDTSLNLHLLTRLFSHLVRLPMSYFSNRHVGDVVSRFDSLGTIRRTLTQTFLEAVVDGFMALATGVMMVIYSWKLALIVVGSAALYGVLRRARYRPLREASEDQIVCGAKQQTNFLETVLQIVPLYRLRAIGGSLYILGAFLMAYNLWRTARAGVFIPEQEAQPAQLSFTT